VAFPTENPPHNQVTIIFPKNGIAETKLVITVAPQNDICPHGKTYPKKAVAIKANKIRIPDIHTWNIL
jgi:outer membrane protein assembly factor BamE (lipoprotein component of BamABCDE complex)